MINPMRPYYGPQATPRTFAPEVNDTETPMSPASAPVVRPMRNGAPGQLQQTGDTLEQAGETAMHVGDTIGDRVQDTMDEASTKAAENQFLQKALPVVAQYSSTEGINATQQFEPAAQAIAKARQDARATLTNPIQQQMFDQATNAHVLTFGERMAAHENVQRVQYGKNTALARADNLNQLSTLDVAGRNRVGSDFSLYAAQSDAEVLHYASLSGIAPDSPQAQELLRRNRTQRDQAVVESLLDSHAYNEAGDFFTEHKGEMDVQAAERIGSAVKSATDAEQVTQYRNQAVQSLRKTSGAGPLSQPIPAATISTTDGENGIDIHTVAGTSVHAPASGIVTKVWDDPKLGLSAQIALPNGYTATFNNLSAVNYKQGQKITQGQPLGLSGQNFVHYAMTDPKGAYVDPRQAVSAPYDPQNFSTPEDEEKAIAWIDKNVSDPVMQREAENQVRVLANTNRTIQNQQHAAALKQATDYVLDHGGSLAGMPTNIKMQLTPEDLEGFQAKGMQMYHLDQAEKDRAEVPLLAQWNANPKTMTVDAVRQAYAQGKLSDETYLTSLRQAQRLQGSSTGATDPAKVQNATIDHSQLTDILELNNLPNLAHPPSGKNGVAYQKARASLEIAVRNEIQRQQDNLKRPLTWQEKGKIARDMVIDKVYTSEGVFGGTSGLMPIAAANPQQQQNAMVWVNGRKVKMADIPPKYALAATEDLQANHLPATQANIAAWWMKKGEPTQ